MNNKQNKAKDSYQEFLDSFEIDKESLYQWGISATIFPPIETVTAAWYNLKERIFTNQKVYIRGYGRDAHGTQLYKDLYRVLFGNSHIEKDPTNNVIPQRHIEQLTHLRRNADLYNYQVSHIWGHTKNVFMFEAPWNICYTPKLIDPFTGHETKGAWPDEYQKLFIEYAHTIYKPFIDEYNKIMMEYHVTEQIDEYLQVLKYTIPAKEFAQFEKDVRKELSLIEC